MKTVLLDSFSDEEIVAMREDEVCSFKCEAN